MDIVREHRKKVEDTPEPQQVIRPQSVGPKRKGRFADFEVHEDKQNPGAFIVNGHKIDRWIMQNGFEIDEAIGIVAGHTGMSRAASASPTAWPRLASRRPCGRPLPWTAPRSPSAGSPSSGTRRPWRAWTRPRRTAVARTAAWSRRTA